MLIFVQHQTFKHVVWLVQNLNVLRRITSVGALGHVLMHLQFAGVEPSRERLERRELVRGGIKLAQSIRRDVIFVVDEYRI